MLNEVLESEIENYGNFRNGKEENDKVPSTASIFKNEICHTLWNTEVKYYTVVHCDRFSYAHDQGYIFAHHCEIS